MDPADAAKYLNGPETDLFDKGRSLFNHGPAREAAGKGRPLIVAEGYMDVIALSEAGFRRHGRPARHRDHRGPAAQLIWRIHPEPVVALDGDKAGLNAALRLIDLALPLLEAGSSLRFAILPAGQDPDDLIRAQGAPAMQRSSTRRSRWWPALAARDRRPRLRQPRTPRGARQDAARGST
jgi:DNA primase